MNHRTTHHQGIDYVPFFIGLSFAAPAQSNQYRPRPPSARPPPGVENSVVKVFSTVRYPDPYKPWAKESPSEETGTGVVIKGKRILTNAHVVGYASQVQIQANQAGDKISATVEYIAPGIDLAVLKLDDDSFFDTHPPLPESQKLCPRSRTRSWPMVILKAVTAFPSPKASSRGLNLRRTNPWGRAVYACRLMPPSTRATAVVHAVVGDKMIGLVFSHLGQAQ